MINLGTDLLLIKYIGLYAASLSTLIAYGVMMIYRCIDVQKYIRISIPLKKYVGLLVLQLLSHGHIIHRIDFFK